MADFHDPSGELIKLDRVILESMSLLSWDKRRAFVSDKLSTTVTIERVRSRYRRMKQHAIDDNHPNTLHPLKEMIIVDPPTTDPPYPEDILRKAKDISFLARREKPPRSYKVQLEPKDGWVSIAFSYDHHVGDRYTDYEKIESDIDMLCRSDAYVVIGGDIWQNAKAHSKAATALYDSVLTKEEEYVLTGKLFEPVAKRICGVITGNHDFWDYQSGIDRMAMWCKEWGLSYWSHGGIVEFQVGDNYYFGGLRHDFPGASSVNTSNQGRSMVQKMSRPIEAGHLDFAIVGHLHYNDLHLMTTPTGRTIYARAGTYQTYSKYAHQRMGSSHAAPGTPIMLLSSAERLCYGFDGTQTRVALEVFLPALRAAYRARGDDEETF